jgi:predicted enzyme related to lactoylglutathione lyase
MMKCDICIDVNDVAEAVRFYGEGIGLSVVKQDQEWAQMKIGEQTIWLMKVSVRKAGTITREYSRHWTPVHLDIHVDDLDQTIKRAVAAGGKPEARPKASLANLVDPSGNGVDIVQASDK